MPKQRCTSTLDAFLLSLPDDVFVITSSSKMRGPASTENVTATMRRRLNGHKTKLATLMVALVTTVVTAGTVATMAMEAEVGFLGVPRLRLKF